MNEKEPRLGTVIPRQHMRDRRGRLGRVLVRVVLLMRDIQVLGLDKQGGDSWMGLGGYGVWDGIGVFGVGGFMEGSCIKRFYRTSFGE